MPRPSKLTWTNLQQFMQIQNSRQSSKHDKSFFNFYNFIHLTIACMFYTCICLGPALAHMKIFVLLFLLALTLTSFCGLCLLLFLFLSSCCANHCVVIFRFLPLCSLCVSVTRWWTDWLPNLITDWLIYVIDILTYLATDRKCYDKMRDVKAYILS